MIAVIFGTTGELIKVAPVLRRLRAQGQPALVATTGQQVEQIPTMLEDFALPQPDVWLGRGNRGRDLERTPNLPYWLFYVARRFAAERRGLKARLRAAPTRPLVLVHGDTMTTVLGAAMGRSLGVEVAHVEGGLRSGNWRNPFPEELDRRMTSRLASLHFAPGAWAAGNLRRAGVSGTIVDTGANTIRDALDLVPPGVVPAVPVPDEPFGIVSLHRFELLGDRDALRAILELLRESSARRPLLFVDHPVTISAVASAGLDHLFGPRFVRIPRQRYFPFISLLKASSFLVTDSGGSQEESAHLGHPCLIHRATTERREGLGGPVVLSEMRIDVVRDFLADPMRHTAAPEPVEHGPTDVIVSHLTRAGYLAG